MAQAMLTAEKGLQVSHIALSLAPLLHAYLIPSNKTRSITAIKKLHTGVAIANPN